MPTEISMIWFVAVNLAVLTVMAYKMGWNTRRIALCVFGFYWTIW